MTPEDKAAFEAWKKSMPCTLTSNTYEMAWQAALEYARQQPKPVRLTTADIQALRDAYAAKHMTFLRVHRGQCICMPEDLEGFALEVQTALIAKNGSGVQTHPESASKQVPDSNLGGVQDEMKPAIVRLSDEEITQIANRLEQQGDTLRQFAHAIMDACGAKDAQPLVSLLVCINRVSSMLPPSLAEAIEQELAKWEGI